MEKKHTIAIIDDHVLIRKSLAMLVNTFDSFEVLFEADSGSHFVEQLSHFEVPEIVILDIKMPDMDGFDTCTWITQHRPQIKVLVLSMYENEMRIIRMLRCGAKGYIVKDCEPAELKNALHAVTTKDFYYSDLVSGTLLHSIKKLENAGLEQLIQLKDHEIEFLKLCCTDMSYKEIAKKMNKAPKTINGYSQSLFTDLNVHSRVGLVLYAIKNGIVNL